MTSISRKGYRPVVDPGEVLVLTGPPATGKSTGAALIADRWDLSVDLERIISLRSPLGVATTALAVRVT